MAIKLNTTSGSITLDAEDGSGNVNVTLPRSGIIGAAVLEDDDGTEVTLGDANEIKFIGSGITTNWTDTSHGSDGDPFDMTFTVDAAQTGITSIYATDLILGEDTQTAIDFGTANEIDFKVDNATRLTMTSGAVYPITTNQIDLGTASLEFKDAFFDGTVTSDAFAGPLTGNATTVTTNANLTGHVTSTGNAAVLGSFTSAQLSTALSDETGSGAAVFATSPTLVTPALGTPASGTLTNATGLPAAGVVGTAAILGANTFTALQTQSAGADIASATAVDLTAATGNVVVITGTTTSTSLTMTAGQQMILIAAAAWPLTFHATTMNIIGGSSYTCAAGDRLYVTKDVDNVIRVSVSKQDGTAVVGASGDASQALSDGATINWDVDDGNLGTVTIAGNRTIAAPTNLPVGSMILKLTQDGSGSRTITWNSVFKWSAGAAPVLSTAANALDILSFVSDGTNVYGTLALRGAA
jgi:hypothetical protein